MSKKLTKRDMVLRFLQDYGSINPMQALNEFGCFSLSQRVSELKHLGHNIVTERETKIGLFDCKVNFAKYVLLAGGEDE